MAKDKRKNALSKRTMPEVQAALICENVIQSQDKKYTIVSIFDTLTLRGHSDTIPAGVAGFVVFVALKSGEVRGQRTVKILGICPEGENQFEHEAKVKFQESHSGHTITLQAQVFVRTAGLYWFHVLVNEELLTRIPLLIRFEQQIDGLDSSAEEKSGKTPKRKRSRKK